MALAVSFDTDAGGGDVVQVATVITADSCWVAFPAVGLIALCVDGIAFADGSGDQFLRPHRILVGLLVCGAPGGVCGAGPEPECGLVGQVALCGICVEGECEAIRPDRDAVDGNWCGGSVVGMAPAHRGGITIWLLRQYIFIDSVVGV